MAQVGEETDVIPSCYALRALGLGEAVSRTRATVSESATKPPVDQTAMAYKTAAWSSRTAGYMVAGQGGRSWRVEAEQVEAIL